ncbi:MAG: acyltransferase [Planctomycetaceae bacterium]|nr:acyltransferase [Planctomycetaceae bacterium]
MSHETFNRDEYVRQHGSEGPLRLLWRKILGRLQRCLPFASMRRCAAKRMGVNMPVQSGDKSPWIGVEVYLDDTFPELLTVEGNVILGVRCMLLCHDDAKRTVAAIHIKRGAYIGAGAIVLPGVTVGESSIVGAGAVVTKDIPDGEAWAGVPARKVESGGSSGDRIGA